MLVLLDVLFLYIILRIMVHFGVLGVLRLTWRTWRTKDTHLVAFGSLVLIYTNDNVAVAY